MVTYQQSKVVPRNNPRLCSENIQGKREVFLFKINIMIMKLSAIKRIENAAQKYDNVISLAQGIPAFYSHPLIRRRVIKAINSNKVDKYSLVAGIPELRILISQYLAEDGMEYDSDNEIIVTNGAISGFTATILTLLKQGDEILVPTPTYAYYHKMANLAHANIVEIPLQENKQWHMNIDQVKQALTSKTKAIVISNPNNPTGSVYSQEFLINLGKLAVEKNFYILIDSVYDLITFEHNQVYNLCQNPEFKQNIIRVVSMSKHFNLSGWRIGFLHGPQKLVEKILPVFDVMSNCASVPSQYAALAALKNQSKIVPQYLEHYQKNYQLVNQYLDQMSSHLSYVKPQGAYYIFPKLKRIKDSEDFCFNVLDKVQVALVPGSEFGKGGEGHFRICFGRHQDQLVEGLDRLNLYFKLYDK